MTNLKTTRQLGLAAVILAMAFSAKVAMAHHFKGHIAKRLPGDEAVTLEQTFNVTKALQPKGYKGPRPAHLSTRLVRIVTLKAKGRPGSEVSK